MTLAPILAAPPAIQMHAVAAASALVLALVQIAGAKGSLAHRVLGWLWVGLMAVVALSGLAIHTVQLWGIWSPLHLLSLLVLATLPGAVMAARRGRRRAHARAMLALAGFGLVGAGAFTLMPHRLLGQVVFGPP